MARASEQGQPCPGKEGSGGSCGWDGALGWPSVQPHVPPPYGRLLPRFSSSGSGLAFDDTGFGGESKENELSVLTQNPAQTASPVWDLGRDSALPASGQSAQGGVDRSYPLASLRGEAENTHLRHGDPVWRALGQP